MATFTEVINAAIDVAVKRATLAAHPVGSIIITNDSRNPSEYIGGGWTLLTDVVLVGAGGKYALNQTGGAESVSYTPAGTVGGTAISVDQMPSHGHSASTDTKGAHTHGRGTTEISGVFGGVVKGSTETVATYASGAFSDGGSIGSKTYGAQVSSEKFWRRITFAASDKWSGATDSKGGHTHTITVGNKGGGKTHSHGFTGTAATINTMMPFIGKYIWQRTD